MLLGWVSCARVIHECLPVLTCKCAACDLVLEAAFPMKHLQPARCCALQIESKKGLHTRKGARLTSHLKKLGGSLTWLLQDCLSIPHLS